VIEDFYSAAEAARRAARGETGSLSVAFAASLISLSLPKIIRRFREEFPTCDSSSESSRPDRKSPRFEPGELDIGFLREPPADDAFVTETVMRERLLLAISKRHPLASRKRLRLIDVANEDFVLFPRDLAPGLHANVLAMCAQAGVQPRIVQTCRELYTTISLVEADLGVTIIPETVRKMGLARRALLPAHVTARLDANRRRVAARTTRVQSFPAFLAIAKAMSR
jgi:DNA-binding transcriptional LysR family regulator